METAKFELQSQQRTRILLLRLDYLTLNHKLLNSWTTELIMQGYKYLIWTLRNCNKQVSLPYVTLFATLITPMIL